MKKGIKNRLVWSYLLLIIFTVAVFETIILSALFIYYQQGIKQTLRDQGAMFISFYEQELMDERFEDNAGQYLSRYRFLVNAHVQLVGPDGTIMAETHNSGQSNLLRKEDVQTGIKGETGYSSAKMNGEKTLSASVPLSTGDGNTGVIRLTTSMTQLNEVFTKNAVLLLSVGGVVICLALVVSFFLAFTITRPVSFITKAAEQMAAGEFSTRITREKDDEIGRLADTLNFMAQQVQKHEQIKNEFIASVSHDLRTPLTSVKGWAVTLHSMADDTFFKEGLEIISNESDRLTTMVSDLLDLSSLSSGRLTFSFDKVPLHSLVIETVQQLKPRAKRDGITLSINQGLMPSIHGADTMFKINGDKNRLKQVLVNLIDNALKFTPVGGKIMVNLEKDGQEVILSIDDNGIGIDQSQLEAVKDKFVKGKSKGAGTGLGLAICEEIIQKHSGSFVLESEPGKGTSAVIRLPLYTATFYN
ncbi:HAMP domain-containing histidine kinase [Mesobacillus foraminis]|uniref:HAMP domain-containing sensor histidine kinase n=1 Tax=Mesobacillus foraminis TaxID=279826 RepID=UPI001BEC2076|nr:HAMP domain-containing sensor histidine kinase [Mesobacillus foraminis]MBT2757002.1 HAMP domain-containing histidine kinase [Mesobacillus foraminis]